MAAQHLSFCDAGRLPQEGQDDQSASSTSPQDSPLGGALLTRSGSEGAASPVGRWNQQVGQARHEAGPTSAQHHMNESTLLEALGPRVSQR